MNCKMLVDLVVNDINVFNFLVIVVKGKINV